MASRVLSKDPSANVTRLEGKIFCFCKFCELYVHRGKLINPESPRGQYENAK